MKETKNKNGYAQKKTVPSKKAWSQSGGRKTKYTIGWKGFVDQERLKPGVK